MAVGNPLPVKDIGPVGVRNAVPHAAGEQLLAGALAGLRLEVDEFFGIQDLGPVTQRSDGKLVVVEDGAVLALGIGTVLGGDEDDAVTGLRTIDGGRCGILQHLHGLDHGRVQILDVVHLEAVHDKERTQAGAAVGGDTAHADVGRFAGGAGVGVHLHAGGLALQGGGGIRSGPVGQFFGADRGHGTGEVALALYAVTDNHRLFDGFYILFQDDIKEGLVAHREGLGYIAQAFDGKCCPGRDIERKGTFCIRNGGHVVTADHHDHCTDNRLAADIRNSTFYRPILSLGRKASQKNGEYRQDTHGRKKFFNHQDSC